MNWNEHKKKLMVGITMGFFIVTGTYNAIVINSESTISGVDARFVKRLDEVYGVTTSGRLVATSVPWQKLSLKQAAIRKTKQIIPKFIAKEQPKSESKEVASAEPQVQAAVQDELNLTLTEVVNPRKWAQGLNNGQFSGSLTTNQGTIENLNVSLPNGEGISVSFSEMAGNVFEYDMDGELYSGMMYQVDQNSYMVTLSNGPLEGTRLRFNGSPSDQVQPQEQLAENHGMNADNLDVEQNLPQPEMQQPAPQVAQYDQQMQQDQQFQQMEQPQMEMQQPQDQLAQPEQMAQQEVAPLEQTGYQFQTFDINQQTVQ